MIQLIAAAEVIGNACVPHWGAIGRSFENRRLDAAYTPDLFALFIDIGALAAIL